MQAVADQEAAVIIQEGDQLDAAVLPLEDKGEQVGLPELVGASALETAGAVRVRPRRRLLKWSRGTNSGTNIPQESGKNCVQGRL
jgi:hypothetical protein